MKISFIGSGNVATHLAKSLFVLEYKIVQVYSQTIQNAQILASQVGATAIDQLTALQAADLYIIAVTDAAIAKISADLAPLELKGVVVHTSGSTDISILKNVGSHHGVFYPLQTFSKALNTDFKTIPLLLEASNLELLNQLDQLASQLSDQVYHYNSEQRRSLHLSAVIACNFSNYLYAVAQQYLDQQGVDFNLLKPLIMETAHKIQQHAPASVQTGPAIRQDHAILVMHQQMLANQPALQQLYQLLSNGIIEMKDIKDIKANDMR